MKPFEKRLIEEYISLSDKQFKLSKALNSDGFEDKVGKDQFELMAEQYKVMQKYSEILKNQIHFLNIDE